MWVVDVNRQSLDRVIPDQKIKKLVEFFDGAGWHVIEAKYGRLMNEACARRPAAASCAPTSTRWRTSGTRACSPHGPNCAPGSSTARTPVFGRSSPAYDDDELERIVTNLGGHDLGVLLDAYRACDEVTDRPSVVFAYTIKGWGLPMAGDPLNHAALLTADQIADLRTASGWTWTRSGTGSPEGSPEDLACAGTGGELTNRPPRPRPHVPVPDATGALVTRPVSTQETFGRVLTSLANMPAVAERMVTTSPDVSVSTNLGGWINKMGVFAPAETGPTTSESTGCCGGSSPPPAITSNSASAR